MSDTTKQTTENSVEVTKSAMNDDYRTSLRTYLEKFVLIPTTPKSNGQKQVTTA